MSLEEDVQILRELLWLSHGHTGQHGDDGEMQCMQCLHEYGFYDWKRTPVKEIAEKIHAGNLRKFVANQYAENGQAKDGDPIIEAGVKFILDTSFGGE